MAADKERDPGSSSAEIGKYLDILAKDPNSRVFAPLAEAYRKAGHFDDAVEIALEGLKVHPNYLGGRVALGRAYFEKRQYAEAAAEMQKVAKSAPDNIIAHKVLGQIAYAQNDLPAAEKSFKMVLLLDPRDQEAHQFVANLAAGAALAPAPVPESAPAWQPALPVSPPPPTPAAMTTSPTATARPAMPDVEPRPAPPTSAPPVAEPLPFEELNAIEDVDLQAEDIFGDPDRVAPRSGMPTQAATPPTAAATGDATLEEFGAGMSLDLAEPESWLSGESPAASPGETSAAPSAPEPAVGAARPPVEPREPDGVMQLEVFSREPWGGEADRAASQPPAPQAAAAEPQESPFEVFGRPKRGGPPQSSRGEQEAFGEIDLQAAVVEPEPLETESAPDSASPFEVFTRLQGQIATPPPAKAVRGGSAGPRELDVETTAYMPPETVDAEAPAFDLDDEFPPIDLAPEVEPDSPRESTPVVAAAQAESAVVPAPAPDSVIELESGPGMDLEFEMGSDLELEQFVSREPQPPAAPVPDEPASPPPEAEIEEPRFDPFAEEDEETEPEEEAPGAAEGRGVFDTETLASIYVNQGFYGRAAEIYQRLITQRPDDAGLRGKLEAALARERGDAGIGEAVTATAVDAPPPVQSALAPEASEPAPAGRAGSELMVSRLQTLLETFKEGRPR